MVKGYPLEDQSATSIIHFRLTIIMMKKCILLVTMEEVILEVQIGSIIIPNFSVEEGILEEKDHTTQEVPL